MCLKEGLPFLLGCGNPSWGTGLCRSVELGLLVGSLAAPLNGMSLTRLFCRGGSWFAGVTRPPRGRPEAQPTLGEGNGEDEEGRSRRSRGKSL